jgi:hypothetical protein
VDDFACHGLIDWGNFSPEHETFAILWPRLASDAGTSDESYGDATAKLPRCFEKRIQLYLNAACAERVHVTATSNANDQKRSSKEKSHGETLAMTDEGAVCSWVDSHVRKGDS